MIDPTRRLWNAPGASFIEVVDILEICHQLHRIISRLRTIDGFHCPYNFQLLAGYVFEMHVSWQKVGEHRIPPLHLPYLREAWNVKYWNIYTLTLIKQFFHIVFKFYEARFLSLTMDTSCIFSYISLA